MDSFQKMTKTEIFCFSMPIYNNFHYIESEEKRMSDLMLICIRFKNVGLLYRRVGAGAASKFSPGAA
jgi:hypothetical protein